MIYRRVFDLPTWRFRSPYEELDRIRRQMQQLYEEARPSNQPSRAGVFPLINVTESADNYFVRAELPGLKAEEIDIQVTANNLSLSGERKIPTEEADAKYHRKEREEGSFSRMIVLPGDVDTERVDAKLQNGILTVTVPKAEAAKPRQISIR